MLKEHAVYRYPWRMNQISSTHGLQALKNRTEYRRCLALTSGTLPLRSRYVLDASVLGAVLNMDDPAHQESYWFFKNLHDTAAASWVVPGLIFFELQAIRARRSPRKTALVWRFGIKGILQGYLASSAAPSDLALIQPSKNNVFSLFGHVRSNTLCTYAAAVCLS